MTYGFDTDIAGRTLVGVDLHESRTALRLRYANDPPTFYEAYGDCCSSSWVEHLTVPDLGSGALIIGVSEADVDDEGDEYDVIRVYHTVIRTNKGEVIIEYRNRSNGYYGGSLDEMRQGDWNFPNEWMEDK